MLIGPKPMGYERGNIRLIMVGDVACGKTCILSTFAESHFPNKYEATGKYYEN